MKKIFSLLAAIMMAGTLMAGRSFSAGEVLYQNAGAVSWWRDGSAVLRATFDGTDTYIGVAAADGVHYGFTITEAKTYSTVVFDRAASTTASAWNATGAISLDGTTLNSVEVFAQNSTDATWGTYDPSAAVEINYYIKHCFPQGWVWKQLAREGETNIYSLRDVYGGTGCNWNTTNSDTNCSWIAEPTLAGGVASGDSAVFAFDADARTITITKIATAVDPEPEPEPVVNYYLAGSFNDWNLAEAMAMNGDTIEIKNLAAGTYKVKVITPAIKNGTDASWTTALGYNQLDPECSSENINSESNGNIVVTLAEAGDVKIKVVAGWLCITGNFAAPAVDITGYTVAGAAALMGVAWDPTATANDMVQDAETGIFELVKTGVELEAGSYDYKVAANHSWEVSNYPAEGNQKLAITEAGIYTVTFTFDPATPSLTAEAVKAPVTALENVEQAEIRKVIENGQLVIIKNGVRYNAMGQVM